jgi:hypothetical protein
LLAHVEDGAGAAFGEVAGADVFAEGDKEAVELDPELAREFLVEQRHCFFGRWSFDVAPAVGDSVDVDVDADARLAAGDAED